VKADAENRPLRSFRPNLPRTIRDKPGIQSYIASVCIADAVHACDDQRRDDWIEESLCRSVATVIFIPLRLCMTVRLCFVALVPRWAGSKN